MPGPDYHAWTHAPDGTDPIEFPASTSQFAAPAQELPMWLPVHASQTTPKRWPGGVRAIPLYPFVTGGAGTTGSKDGWSHRQITETQTAANYGAAAVSATGTITSFDLVAGLNYQIWATSRHGGSATAWKLGVKATSWGAEAEATYATDERYYYSIQRVGADTGYVFADGDTIDIKMYITSGSGTVYADQLVLIPNNEVFDSGEAVNFDQHQMYAMRYARLDVSEFGPTVTGFNTTQDPYMLDGGGADDQLRDHVYDFAASQRWSFWKFDPIQFQFNMGSLTAMEFESRYPRHVYVIARTKTGTEDDASRVLVNYTSHITLGDDSMTRASAPVWSPNPTWYYLGRVIRSSGQLQLMLWRNNNRDFDNVPFAHDTDTAFDDVRASVVMLVSSFNDDSTLNPPS